MDEFTKALLSGESKIPDNDDWFKPLLGDWQFEYFDISGRNAQGEWFFRRTLDGNAIEDIFICPSRATAATNPQPDGEYGAAIRMYRKDMHCYDMTYITDRFTVRLTVTKNNERIECKVNSSAEKWVFSEISENTFVWNNITVLDDETEKINATVHAERLKD